MGAQTIAAAIERRPKNDARPNAAAPAPALQTKTERGGGAAQPRSFAPSLWSAASRRRGRSPGFEPAWAEGRRPPPKKTASVDYKPIRRSAFSARAAAPGLKRREGAWARLEKSRAQAQAGWKPTPAKPSNPTGLKAQPIRFSLAKPGRPSLTQPNIAAHPAQPNPTQAKPDQTRPNKGSPPRTNPAQPGPTLARSAQPSPGHARALRPGPTRPSLVQGSIPPAAAWDPGLADPDPKPGDPTGLCRRWASRSAGSPLQPIPAPTAADAIGANAVRTQETATEKNNKREMREREAQRRNRSDVGPGRRPEAPRSPPKRPKPPLDPPPRPKSGPGATAPTFHASWCRACRPPLAPNPGQAQRRRIFPKRRNRGARFRLLIAARPPYGVGARGRDSSGLSRGSIEKQILAHVKWAVIRLFPPFFGLKRRFPTRSRRRKNPGAAWLFFGGREGALAGARPVIPKGRAAAPGAAAKPHDARAKAQPRTPRCMGPGRPERHGLRPARRPRRDGAAGFTILTWRQAWIPTDPARRPQTTGPGRRRFGNRAGTQEQPLGTTWAQRRRRGRNRPGACRSARTEKPARALARHMGRSRLGSRARFRRGASLIRASVGQAAGLRLRGRRPPKRGLRPNRGACSLSPDPLGRFRSLFHSLSQWALRGPDGAFGRRAATGRFGPAAPLFLVDSPLNFFNFRFVAVADSLRPIRLFCACAAKRIGGEPPRPSGDDEPTTS